MQENSGTIVSIGIQSGKDTPWQEVPQALCVAGMGIEGDRHYGKKEAVSLVPTETLAQCEKMPVAGLCTARFKANIVYQGAAPHIWDAGQQLRAGAALLRVERRGKPCFDNCEHFASHGPCPLATGCLFASVQQGGLIRPGDAIGP